MINTNPSNYVINNGIYIYIYIYISNFVDLTTLNPTITVTILVKIQSHNHSLFGSLHNKRVRTTIKNFVSKHINYTMGTSALPDIILYALT